MSRTLKEILDQALELPAQDRAQLAAELLASLEPPGDLDHEAAWAAEIERRARRVLAGESSSTPWEEARIRLRSLLDR